MSGEPWIAYDFAVLRAVPHPHLGRWIPVGVVLHARTAEFLGMRSLEGEALRRRVPELDPERLERYLGSLRAVCEGLERAGPLALDPTSERFHWMTAPRSDVLQPSAVHGGVTRDPAATLQRLFVCHVVAGDG
ncbi:MAG TPA: DUF3037 domain-containing protein [Longimicrobiales bacterium]|nr:DUF3037 domain-containing protein [Longimicrobiales bacterium]